MTNEETFRFPRRLAIATFLSMLVVAVGAMPCFAGNEKPASGSSSKQFRHQAVASIPFERINRQGQAKISDVVSKSSVYRRLPVTTINCDGDYYNFLVRYPEVIVNIWRLMGVTKMTTERVGPFSVATNDGAGTISELELIYGTEDLHIFYGKGTYEGPVLKRKLQGKCVLVLRTNSGSDTTGKPAVTSQLDVFLKIENATAGFIAKTLTPLVGSTADHNFVESLKFVQRLNETTEKNGPGVQNMGKRLEISDEVRSKFNKTVDLVFDRSLNSGGPQQNRALNSSNSLTPKTQAPVYNTFQDNARGRTSYQPAGYPTQQPTGNRDQFKNDPRYAPPSVMPTTSQYSIPARGSQAPSYPGNYRGAHYHSPANRTAPNHATPGNQSPLRQNPVQANYYCQFGNAQEIKPTGWRQR